jgi:hypothetical protein
VNNDNRNPHNPAQSWKAILESSCACMRRRWCCLFLLLSIGGAHQACAVSPSILGTYTLAPVARNTSLICLMPSSAISASALPWA